VVIQSRWSPPFGDHQQRSASLLPFWMARRQNRGRRQAAVLLFLYTVKKWPARWHAPRSSFKAIIQIFHFKIFWFFLRREGSLYSGRIARQGGCYFNEAGPVGNRNGLKGRKTRRLGSHISSLRSSDSAALALTGSPFPHLPPNRPTSSRFPKFF
jgi:hypothetical protein